MTAKPILIDTDRAGSYARTAGALLRALERIA